MKKRVYYPGKFIYSLYEKYLWRQIKSGPQPHHVGIIMDGNRRFAKKIGLPVELGHKYGLKKLKELLRWMFALDIKVITLFSFSTENFNRSDSEVSSLMELFRENFLKLAEDPEIHEKKVKVKAIGRLNLLPKKIQDAIKTAEQSTSSYSEKTLQVAISYGGRQEILDAIKKISIAYKNNELELDDIDEDLVSRFLYTSDVPDPDLIIRTSGEERLSGFMLWQSAYSELIFIDVNFPILRKIDLWRAIRTFQQRNRRYGQ